MKSKDLERAVAAHARAERSEVDVVRAVEVELDLASI